MNNLNSKKPANSKAMDQAELQAAKQDMNTDQGMSQGSFTNEAYNPSNFQNAVDQATLQEAKRKVQESGMKNNLS